MLVGIFALCFPRFTQWQSDKESKELIDVVWDQMDPNCEDEELVVLDDAVSWDGAESLAREYTQLDLQDEESTTGPRMTKEEKRQELLKKQTVYGIVEIPEIDVYYAVVKGTDNENIRVAIGHMEGTAHFGQIGNCVLAGHRGGMYSTFFKNIDKLKQGSVVKVTNMRKEEFTYRVYEKIVVEPTDTSVIRNIGEEKTLTLISCEENGTKRLIVRCRMEES